MYPFVTPALPSQSLEQLWKSFLRSLMGQLQEQLNQRLEFQNKTAALLSTLFAFVRVPTSWPHVLQRN
jgi:hypothetical protein